MVEGKSSSNRHRGFKLGNDGYPVLNLTISGTAIDGRKGDESLAYLFDPDRSHDGKAVYEDVQNLLSIDETLLFL